MGRKKTLGAPESIFDNLGKPEKRKQLEEMILGIQNWDVFLKEAGEVKALSPEEERESIEQIKMGYEYEEALTRLVQVYQEKILHVVLEFINSDDPPMSIIKCGEAPQELPSIFLDLVEDGIQGIKELAQLCEAKDGSFFEYVAKFIRQNVRKQINARICQSTQSEVVDRFPEKNYMSVYEGYELYMAEQIVEQIKKGNIDVGEELPLSQEHKKTLGEHNIYFYILYLHYVKNLNYAEIDRSLNLKKNTTRGRICDGYRPKIFNRNNRPPVERFVLTENNRGEYIDVLADRFFQRSSDNDLYKLMNFVDEEEELIKLSSGMEKFGCNCSKISKIDGGSYKMSADNSFFELHLIVSTKKFIEIPIEDVFLRSEKIRFFKKMFKHFDFNKEKNFFRTRKPISFEFKKEFKILCEELRIRASISQKHIFIRPSEALCRITEDKKIKQRLDGLPKNYRNFPKEVEESFLLVMDKVETLLGEIKEKLNLLLACGPADRRYVIAGLKILYEVTRSEEVKQYLETISQNYNKPSKGKEVSSSSIIDKIKSLSREKMAGEIGIRIPKFNNLLLQYQKNGGKLDYQKEIDTLKQEVNYEKRCLDAGMKRLQEYPKYLYLRKGYKSLLDIQGYSEGSEDIPGELMKQAVDELTSALSSLGPVDILPAVIQQIYREFYNYLQQFSPVSVAELASPNSACFVESAQIPEPSKPEPELVQKSEPKPKPKPPKIIRQKQLSKSIQPEDRDWDDDKERPEDINLLTETFENEELEEPENKLRLVEEDVDFLESLGPDFGPEDFEEEEEEYPLDEI